MIVKPFLEKVKLDVIIGDTFPLKYKLYFLDKVCYMHDSLYVKIVQYYSQPPPQFSIKDTYKLTTFKDVLITGAI